MSRRCVAAFATLAFVAAAGPLAAQPRVAYVGFQAEPREGSRLREAFLAGLRERGYVPGRDVRVDVHSWKSVDELRRAMREVVRGKVDVIVAGPPIAAIVAREATRDIPIVCASCGDPLENGLAKTLARPQGNVTGLASLSAELIGKRFELARELIPGASRVSVLLFPANPGTPPTLAALQRIEPALRVTIQRLEVRSRDDFAVAFRSAAGAQAQAVVVQDDPLVRAAAEQIAALAQQHRLPVIVGLSEAVEAGILMSYGPNRIDMTRRAAVWVEKILKGARAGELPFEQAGKLELVMNLKTAKAIGVGVPREMLTRADRVILE